MAATPEITPEIEGLYRRLIRMQSLGPHYQDRWNATTKQLADLGFEVSGDRQTVKLPENPSDYLAQQAGRSSRAASTAALDAQKASLRRHLDQAKSGVRRSQTATTALERRTAGLNPLSRALDDLAGLQASGMSPEDLAPLQKEVDEVLKSIPDSVLDDIQGRLGSLNVAKLNKAGNLQAHHWKKVLAAAGRTGLRTGAKVGLGGVAGLAAEALMPVELGAADIEDPRYMSPDDPRRLAIERKEEQGMWLESQPGFGTTPPWAGQEPRPRDPAAYETSIRGTSRVPTRSSRGDVIREAERRHLQDIIEATEGEDRFTVEEMQRALSGGPPQETVELRELEESGVLEPTDRVRGFFEEIGMSGARRSLEEPDAPSEVEARVAIGSSAIVGGPGAGTMTQKNFVDLVNRQTKQPIGRFRVGDYVPGLGNIDDIGERASKRPGRPDINVPAIRIVPDDKSVGPYWIMGHDLVPPGTEDILAQRMAPMTALDASGFGPVAMMSRWSQKKQLEGLHGEIMRRQAANQAPQLTWLDRSKNALREAGEADQARAGQSDLYDYSQVPSWQSDVDQALLADDQQVADDELLQGLMGLGAGSSEEAAMRSMRRDSGDAAVEEVYGVSFDGEDFVAVDTADKGTYYYNSDTGESFWGDTEG